MRAFRLLSVVAAIALTATSAVTARAQGPGVPGYLPPGEYRSSSSFAFLQTTINGTLNVSVGVSTVTATNMPKQGFTFPPGGSETVFSISVFDFENFIFFQGCYFISPTDFSASSDLSTMTLITKILDSTPGCGPPGSNNIPAGTVISVQWLGSGPVATSQDETHFSCTAYTQENQSSRSNNLASVSGTLPGLLSDPLSNLPGSMSEGQGDIHVSGVADQTCPPGGNGIGAGPIPPLPAGNFKFLENQEAAIFQSADFTQQILIRAVRDTEVANPSGAPSLPSSSARTNASGVRTSGGPVTTTSTEVEIEISDLNTFTFENGCYLVAPSALQANGIASATLHVHLLGTETQCPNSFDQQNVPMPLTVDATWTGTGPSAPARDTGRFTCATYSTDSTSLRNAVTANSAFTLPELFPGQVFQSNPDASGVSTSDIAVRAQGVEPQSCIGRR